MRQVSMHEAATVIGGADGTGDSGGQGGNSGNNNNSDGNSGGGLTLGQDAAIAYGGLTLGAMISAGLDVASGAAAAGLTPSVMAAAALTSAPVAALGAYGLYEGATHAPAMVGAMVDAAPGVGAATMNGDFNGFGGGYAGMVGSMNNSDYGESP